MLNGRLYRAAFLPFLLALATAAFSLGGRPPALTSTLAPDAFQGPRAFTELRSLLAHYPRAAGRAAALTNGWPGRSRRRSVAWEAPPGGVSQSMSVISKLRRSTAKRD